nr:(2Fe-2S)-binding protein [Pacificimonas flava]
MVVCSCNALRERDVRSAARGGAGCPKSAYAALGCRAQCGRCLPFARDLIRAEHTTTV